ncbi:MAG: hypothetical protein HYZ81_03980 [Nitrospinae bacterium]|nr:hypothetical protein [Nitrospinota bacterium]
MATSIEHFPNPDLVYGQLVKQQKQSKRLTRSTRVVRGAERLAHLGLTLSTVYRAFSKDEGFALSSSLRREDIYRYSF